MCEKCRSTDGNCEELGIVPIDIRIGGQVIGRHELWFHLSNDNNRFVLSTDYAIGSVIVADANIKINYCPFCGRDLRYT